MRRGRENPCERRLVLSVRPILGTGQNQKRRVRPENFQSGCVAKPDAARIEQLISACARPARKGLTLNLQDEKGLGQSGRKNTSTGADLSSFELINQAGMEYNLILILGVFHARFIFKPF